MNLRYSKKVIEHFTHPHNQGNMKNPDGVGIVGNPKCGDIMRMYIKVSKDKKGKYSITRKESLSCFDKSDNLAFAHSFLREKLFGDKPVEAYSISVETKNGYGCN